MAYLIPHPLVLAGFDYVLWLPLCQDGPMALGVCSLRKQRRERMIQTQEVVCCVPLKTGLREARKSAPTEGAAKRHCAGVMGAMLHIP